jgi:hypothetical protein
MHKKGTHDLMPPTIGQAYSNVIHTQLDQNSIYQSVKTQFFSTTDINSQVTLCAKATWLLSHKHVKMCHKALSSSKIV